MAKDAESAVDLPSQTSVKVTKGDPGSSGVEPGTTVPAMPIEPAAKPGVSAPNPLVGGAAVDAPLPLATTIAVTKSAVFAFGRSQATYVVRAWLLKGKSAWTTPVTVVTKYDDDVPAVATTDGEFVWFGASSKTGGARVARISLKGATIAVTEATGSTAKLGTVSAFVPLGTHIGVVGKNADAITFARLSREAQFLDANARVLTKGAPSKLTTPSRSPRATNDEGRLLLAWDADDVSDALESPGTTPTEKAAPKPGVYVQRFTPLGDKASPARRLTRPGFEAHALDVVVELGACAVLASTPDGYEMFRFVRKGEDLPPYGGGLHLAALGADAALSADVMGTVGLTGQKLLRIGPGVKIVSSNLGFTPPPGSSFELARLASEGYYTWGLLGAKAAGGMLPTIVKVDGDHMGTPLPPAWIGPPPQQLLFAGVDGDEAIAIVVDGSSTQVVRLGLDGMSKGTTPLLIDPKDARLLAWARAPVPRAARAGGDWLIALADGRVLVATGPKAGTIVAPGVAPGGGSGSSPGVLGLVPTGGKSATAHAFYLPHPDRNSELAVAAIDPHAGTVGAWSKLLGTEHHYGALGETRHAAVARNDGGVFVLGHAGTKVLSVAQLYSLLTIDRDGKLVTTNLDSPGSLEEATLAPTPAGPALVANISGKGPGARWLDGDGSWRDSYAFLPFRKAGEGPLMRAGGKTQLMPLRAAPLELAPDVANVVGRCPYALPAGPRAVLLVCEEGSGDSPLASRIMTRVLSF